MADTTGKERHVKIITAEDDTGISDESSDDEAFNSPDKNSENPTTSHSQRVDMTRIQSAYSERCHSRSNFPDVLSEYGQEEEEEYKPRVKETKKKKKKVSKKVHDDDDTIEKLRKRREERYIQVMEDIDSKPDGSQYYSKKVSGIAIRVNKQQDQSNASELTPRTQRSHGTNESKKKEIPRFKMTKEKQALQNKLEYLDNIPKTDTAKIIELQDRLIQTGKLRTQADIDKFRKDIKDPNVLNSYIKSQKLDKSSSSTLQTNQNSAPSQDIQPRSLSHISEKSSRSPTREGWAITQQYKHRHEQLNKPLTPAQIAKQAASDLDKRFPRTQMPPLKCFTLDLGEKPPDPEELKREIELKVRIKQRKKFLRKLHRMHQLSMAHNAATNRILEKHGEISQILDGNTLRDVISVLPAPEDAYITEEDIREPDLSEQFAHYAESVPGSRSSVRTNLISQRGSRESLVSQKGSRESLSSQQSYKRSRGSRRTASMRETSTAKMPPIPLTLDEIRQKAKVMEAKCLSTNWVNYMHAGHSFAS